MNFKVIEINNLNDALEIKRKEQSITEEHVKDEDADPVIIVEENSCVAIDNLKFSASSKNSK